ncbi:MAG: sugar phosphate isomerase/epimerase family protein [Vicinamibacterales bacterium]
MISRRELLTGPAALLAWSAAEEIGRAADGRMSLALHQNTSSRAGFRASLEGWARAGITQVEITNGLLDRFLESEPLPAARRLAGDLGLTIVCGACGVSGLLEPNPDRQKALENFRRRCDTWAELGIPIIYSTTATNIKPTADDYRAAPANAHEVGGIAADFGLTALFEFIRISTFASTLTSLLSITRAAAHPNVGPLFDCYHFWSGLNKLEDLEILNPGEVRHVHFQDVPDMPREMLDMTTRVIPGEGVTPLATILRALARKGYAGPLSVELFLPKYSAADPYEIAREIRTKAEAVMRQAQVL